MTISSSLNAGVSGLSANATRLAAISDNIANSDTYGYKRMEADFHSLVISSYGGTYSAGGVRATTHRAIDEKGTLISTNSPTDLAVRGRGMIPVAKASDIAANDGVAQMHLTTTGSFQTDDQGYLRTQSGLVLMGWPARPDGSIPDFPRDTHAGLEPVQITVNQFSGEPTTRMSLGVNLPSTDAEAGASGEARILPVEYYGNLGGSESIEIAFTPTVPADGLSNEWTMTLRDSASAGAVVGEYRLTFDDGRSAGGTLASVTTLSGGDYDPATGTVIVNVDGGPIEIDIGQPGDTDGLTQLAVPFAPVAISKDGLPVGNMTSVEVDSNGYVHALFDTGISRRIFQVPLVDLPNPNGMIAQDSQVYLPSPRSGSYFLWNAGEGPTGDIVAFAREESATDVAAELTSMIRTQRAYSSNAKVIQTVDEMLQETTNIKR